MTGFPAARQHGVLCLLSIFMLRALAARKPNSQIGLFGSFHRSVNEWLV
jgi:hypothetical protein